MATVRMDGMDGGNFKEDLRFDLGHEARHQGTISDISDVYTKESDQYGEKEQFTIIIRSSIEDDLQISDEDKEALVDVIEQENEELDDDKEPYSTDYVELKFYPTANLTRSSGSANNSKLYNTLEKLGLADPQGDDGFTLLDRHGDEISDELKERLEDPDEVDEALAQYLRDNLLGMKVTYELRNVNRGSDDEYSVVNKFISKENDPEAE